MGTYNRTHVELACPRCGGAATMEVDLYFGDTSNMETVPVGAAYPFRSGKSIHNGGVPADGNVDGEGYTECPLCDKDFFVKAIVRNAILTAIEADLNVAPHVP